MKSRISKPYLTYALNGKGKLVHVNDVQTGNNCACFCPHCNSKLCAKNSGKQRIPHFAHLNGADCKGAVESALHIMAKEILQDIKCICLPAIPTICPSKLLHFDKIEVEVYDQKLDLRPDCIGYYGDKVIWIEFKRTHAVDPKKKGKIISACINCIEIDLNECTLDPSEVKKLLINKEDKRIWIYNKEHKYCLQTNSSKVSNRYYDVCDDYYLNNYLNRIFAIDDIGKIVQLNNLDEINMNMHTYHCLGCGKEVCIDVDTNGTYSFKHADKDVVCTKEQYLVETSKAILHNKFHSSEKFEICVDQQHICKHNTNCRFFAEEACYVIKPYFYDLKSFSYDCCEKDVMLRDSGVRVHLLVSRQNDLKNAIIINIKSGGNVAIKSKYKMIEINIRNEKDLLNLKTNGLKDKNLYSSSNFKQCPPDKRRLYADKNEIDRYLWKFILHASGNFIIRKISCKDLSSSNNITIPVLYIRCDDEDLAYFLGLIHCYKNKMKARYCELCFFKEYYDGYYLICKRYKTEETLCCTIEDLPIDCPYFRLNKELVAQKEREAHFAIIDAEPIQNSLSSTPKL